MQDLRFVLTPNLQTLLFSAQRIKLQLTWSNTSHSTQQQNAVANGIVNHDKIKKKTF